MSSTRLTPVLVLAATLGACGGPGAERPLTNVPIPVPEPPAKVVDQELEPAREAPPESGPKKPAPFPKIEHDKLANGLELSLVTARALPVVQLRLLVRSGSSSDGDLTGVARLTAHLLKDGGAGRWGSKDLLARIETLGADLGISVEPDGTVLSLAVAKEHLDEALELLGTIAREPRLDDAEFQKLKKRELDRVADRARSSGGWAANMLLYRELFRLPAGLHPYASYDALPKDLAKLTSLACREFYKKHYTPKNAVLVVAGDVDLDTARKATERALGAWKGGDAPQPSFSEATPPERIRILLADRPKSAQSDVYVGMLGPARRDEAWPQIKVATQVLGGGVSGRLFLDVREKRSLAYGTRASLVEVARGPVPLVAYAGTQTAKTGLAVDALLEHLRRLGTEAPTDDETRIARRYLADVFAVKMETVGSVADMVVSLAVLGLPDDHYDTYRKALDDVTAAAAENEAAEHIRDGHAVIVVAGDAEKLGPVLSHFGEVTVVSPEKGFERTRTIPANPGASIELDREAGQ